MVQGRCPVYEPRSFPFAKLLIRRRTRMTVPMGPDPLTALVQRLPAISAPACQDPDATSHCELEETLQIGHDVWLVRRTGGFYIALVDAGHDVLPHLLDTGLGRLVWTLATARPMNSCERARRILAECGILKV
jgi:hypothetical protein